MAPEVSPLQLLFMQLLFNEKARFFSLNEKASTRRRWSMD